jgi:hypothetical protein
MLAWRVLERMRREIILQSGNVIAVLPPFYTFGRRKS